MTTESPKDPIELSDLILRFWRWKWYLLVAIVVGSGLTYGISKMLRPEYESFTILYPVASSSREKLLEEFAFGFDVHAERLVQMIESTAIRDSVVNKFKLVQRYEVDTTQLGWEDEVTRTYFDKVKPNKTKYKSVAVVVRDYSPDTAAEMANYISGLVNVVNANILKSSAQSQLETIEKAYREKEKEISEKQQQVEVLQKDAALGATSLLMGKINTRQGRIKIYEDSLAAIRSKFKVFDFTSQIEELNRELVIAEANYYQEKGRFETYSPQLPPTDTTLLRIKANMAGAQIRVNIFKQQLADLADASRKFERWNSLLQLEKSGQGYALGEYERISGSYSPEVESLGLERIKSELEWDLLQLNEIREKYEKVLANYLDPLPASYLISEARPSYRKVFPKTLLSVAIAAVFSLFFSYLVLLFREKLAQNP